MCAESLWWRCHRRLVADAAMILAGADVDGAHRDSSQAARKHSPLS
jgi:uncharacterized protein (DUF488 family)